LQVSIVIIWLAIPIASYFLVQNDYAHYHEFSREQRQDCEKRARVLGRYCRLFSSRASQVPTIIDGDSRQVWQTRWTQIRRDYKDENRGLRRTAPEYFPTTDAKLYELEQLIEDQQQAIEEAVRERNAYNRAGGGLELLYQEIHRAAGIAEYYRSIGAYGISDLIDDDVREMEKQYRERTRERKRRQNAMEDALAEADELRKRIINGLEQLDALMTADANSTYPEELKARYQQFNLRRELHALLGLPYKEAAQ